MNLICLFLYSVEVLYLILTLSRATYIFKRFFFPMYNIDVSVSKSNVLTVFFILTINADLKRNELFV